MAEVKVGNWYTFCCQKDLQVIEQEDVLRINGMIEDGCGGGIYESRLEALLDIRETWVRSKEGKSNPESYQEEIDECDEMIRQERAQ